MTSVIRPNDPHFFSVLTQFPVSDSPLTPSSISSPGPGIGYPAGSWRPSLVQPSPAGQIEKDPSALRVRWWRARPNPSYNPVRGSASHWDDEFIRDEIVGEFFCLIEREGILRKYFPSGSIESGDIAIIFNPSTFCAKDGSGNVTATPSEWDHVMELSSATSGTGTSALHGCGGDWVDPGAGTGPDRRTFTQKATIEHGRIELAQAGTVSVTGTAVVGTGTNFLTSFRAGDVLVAAGGRKSRVLSVADATHMTLSAPFTPNFTNLPFAKGVDKLPYWPVVRVQSIQSESREFTIGTDYVIGEDGETVQWLSATNSPTPGERIGIIWDYVPRWSIVDMGQKGVTVRGIPSLTIVQARLWKPETLRQK